MAKIDMTGKSEQELTSTRLLSSNMLANADKMAQKLAPFIAPELERLDAAKQEWEGGRFAVLFRLTDGLTPEELEALPDPRAKTGNNPAYFLTPVIRDGKEKWEETYYYRQLVLDFPGIKARMRRIDILQRSMTDKAASYADIPKEVFDMAPDYREAEATRLNDEIKGAVRSVTGAFELMHQFRKVENLKHVEAYMLFKNGPDSLPLDGEDGRARVIDPTKTPIVVQSTIKARAALDRVMIGIDAFLKMDPDKASETAGGTYGSLLATGKRAKATDEQGQGQTPGDTAGKPQAINTAETAVARIGDVYEYVNRAATDTTKTAWEALDKALHASGNDSDFHAACALHEYLGSLIGSPADQIKYEKLDKAMRAAAKGTAKAA